MDGSWIFLFDAMKFEKAKRAVAGFLWVFIRGRADFSRRATGFD